jgi:hypothetical protein
MVRKKQEPKKEKPEVKQEPKAKKAKKGRKERKKERWLSIWSKATKNVLETKDDLVFKTEVSAQDLDWV